MRGGVDFGAFIRCCKVSSVSVAVLMCGSPLSAPVSLSADVCWITAKQTSASDFCLFIYFFCNFCHAQQEWRCYSFYKRKKKSFPGSLTGFKHYELFQFLLFIVYFSLVQRIRFPLPPVESSDTNNLPGDGLCSSI